MINKSQKGAVPILILIAAVGLVVFLALSSSAEFKHKIFGLLYSKPSSYAVSNPISGPITPTPIPTTVVFDSFNRSDNTSLGNAETGQVWTAIKGKWGISSNMAYPVDSCPKPGYAVVYSGVFDGIIQVTLTINPQGTRIPFRFSDVDNLYWLERTGGSNYQLLKRLRGVESNLGVIKVKPANGDKIKIELAGSNIKISINNILRLNVIDNFPIMTTNYGIGIWCSGKARFDDFSVKSSSISTSPTPSPTIAPSPTSTPSGTLTWIVGAGATCPTQQINVYWSYSGNVYKSLRPVLLDSLAQPQYSPCKTDFNSAYWFTNQTIDQGHVYSITLQLFTDSTCSNLVDAPNKSVTQASCP